MSLPGKKSSTILLVILTLVLIAIVIWLFDKRIKGINKKMEHTAMIHFRK